MPRLPAIDALRGLMLVLMTLTHMPTRFSDMLGQPIGYVSAAEGFVFLSALLAGYIGTARIEMNGIEAMRRWMWRRAGVVYACHVALLAFLFVVIVPIAAARAQPAITDLASHFLRSPVNATLQSLALLYNPPLLDILPLYIVFLAATPFVLAAARKRGWPLVLAASLGLWMLVQIGAVHRLFDVGRYVLELDLPYNQTGSFSLLAWQLMWTLGLWLGYGLATTPADDFRPPVWIGVAALAYASIWLVWRHIAGQVPEPHGGELNVLFDKWTLGPMRVLDFLAVLVAVMALAPRNIEAMIPSWLGRLGRAMLPAFCAHLVVCLTALAFFGAPDAARPLRVDVELLLAAFVVIFCVAALVSVARNRPPARVRTSVLPPAR